MSETDIPCDELQAAANPQQLLALFAETMAAETMARDTATTDQSLPPPWSDEHFATLWGPKWPGHPFLQPPLLWHKDLLETDVTQLVQLFCCDDFAGQRGWERRKAFLRTLWDVQDCCFADAILPQLPSDDSTYKRMRCTAEEPIRLDETTTLNLDLFFSADKDKDGGEFHYAVELKFDALVDNNFEAYNNFVRNKYKSGHPACCLTVLGLDEKISKQMQNNNRIRCLPIAGWYQFLKALEVHICAMRDSEPQFAQFRKSIWLKILRRDYVWDLCYNSAHLQAVPQA